MLGEQRGISVIQFVIGMTVLGLLGLWLGVGLAQRSWRNQQRGHDLDVVAGMINRYPADHFGQYPATSAADDANSNLQLDFAELRLVDPSTGKYYILGTDFGPCNGPAAQNTPGLGYMSYQSPGQNGSPYALRVCLEGGGAYYAAE